MRRRLKQGILFTAVSLGLLGSAGYAQAGTVTPHLVISASSNVSVNPRGIVFDNDSTYVPGSPEGLFSLDYVYEAGTESYPYELESVWTAFPNTPPQLYGLQISPTHRDSIDQADSLWGIDDFGCVHNDFFTKGRRSPFTVGFGIWSGACGGSGEIALAPGYTESTQLAVGVQNSVSPDSNVVFATSITQGVGFAPSCTNGYGPDQAECGTSAICGSDYSCECAPGSLYLWQLNVATGAWVPVWGTTSIYAGTGTTGIPACVYQMGWDSVSSTGSLVQVDGNGNFRTMEWLSTTGQVTWGAEVYNQTAQPGTIPPGAVAAANGAVVFINAVRDFLYVSATQDIDLSYVIPSGACSSPQSVTFDAATGDLYWSSLNGTSYTNANVCKWSACELGVARTCALGGSCSTSGC